ncbi:MAG: AhpC/TSA family protein [Bacteroidetes bacterium]|nr:AhpC/TSA family protein [Bacteroidota bacterium]
MFKILGIYLVIFLCAGCMTSSDNNKYIIIEGHVKNLPEGKLYLTDANFDNKIIDSCLCKNDTFSFKIMLKPGFEPYLVSIHFWNKDKIFEPLVFDSKKVLAPNGKPFSKDAFMLEEGDFHITGTYEGFSPLPNLKVSPLDIIAGPQTEAEFKIVFSGFPLLSGEKQKSLDFNTNIIKQYPYSYYLLSLLNMEKTAFTNAELLAMTKLFDKKMERSIHMKEIQRFMEERPKQGKSIKNFELLDSNSSRVKVFDDGAKIHMVVLWASWCGPCRMEIPVLKKIYSEFIQNRDFEMIGISIDENFQQWEKTVNEESILWKQLIIDSSEVTHIKNLFEFESIPLVLFFNSQMVEVGRYSGFSDSAYTDYLQVLTKELR